MGRFLFPLILGAVFGIAGFCLSLSGYVVPIVMLWPVTVVLLLVSSIPLRREQASPPYLVRVTVIAAMLILLAGCGHGARLLRKWAICQELGPVLSEIEALHKANGTYPLDLSAVHLPSGLRIRTGKMAGEGIDLEEVHDADAVFYLSKDGLLCIVPVTKMLPMSMTRFYVFRWSTEEPHWKSNKMIWSFDHV
jgi:hypothetical protein